jgi:hypothetical protein
MFTQCTTSIQNLYSDEVFLEGVVRHFQAGFTRPGSLRRVALTGACGGASRLQAHQKNV